MDSITGIYVIRNVLDGMRYVGSSVSIVERWYRHRSELRLKKHHNRHLQNAWSKFGEAVFEFEIIEQCDKSLLARYEEQWIALLKSDDTRFGYNLATFTDKPFLGKKHTDETIAKMKKNHRCTVTDETRQAHSRNRLGKKNSEVTRKRISDGNKGKHVKSDEFKEASRNRMLNRSRDQIEKSATLLYKRYIVTSPDGVEVEVLGLKPFCKLNGLHEGNMVSVANGRLRHYKQWKCRKV